MGDQEAPASPKNKVKFLCSHGGKILPRPSDGQLKYVGGETRVVAVPRDISFSELKEKLTSMFEGNVILKYQLIPDELDALVSVTCDEDLKHMLEEYDRQEAKAVSSSSSTSSSSSSSSSPRLRAFLFPSTPFIVSDHHHHSVVSTSHANANDASSMEQRYIDAINGIVRAPGLATTAAPTSNAGVGGRPIFSISSAGSSPKSIIAPADTPFAADTIHQETAAIALYDNMGNIPSTRTFGGNQDTTTVVLCENIGSNPPPAGPFGAHRSFSMHDMHKVQSSPSLLSLGQQQKQHQHQHQNQLHHHHHHYQQQSSRHPRLLVTAPMAAPIDCQVGPQSRYYPSASHQRMTGGCSGYGQHVDGWKPYRTGSGFLPDPDNTPQCSVRQMGAEGYRWNHGLVDYREK